MAPRIDSVQIAIPRATDAQHQQHAAQRQPVAAQEQIAAKGREDLRAKEQRPDALERSQGEVIRDEYVASVAEQNGDGRGNLLGKRRGGQPRRQASSGDEVTDAGSAGAVPARPDGKGSRVDLRL